MRERAREEGVEEMDMSEPRCISAWDSRPRELGSSYLSRPITFSLATYHKPLTTYHNLSLPHFSLPSQPSPAWFHPSPAGYLVRVMSAVSLGRLGT
eukprot:875533-Rhodomonas_salina.1